jgi:DegV family protein with EDD domain
MPKIAFITDTNASLPPDMVQQHGIYEVPIHIQFGEETYVTGQDIDDEKLFEMIDARKVLPTTAAPSPEAFKQAYQKAFDDGADQVICITCSSKVSATYNAAVMASELELFADRDISVVDSLQLSLGEGFQVLAGVEAAADGASKEDILTLLASFQGREHVFGALPTLKYLAMGGRVGKLAAGFADTLNIKPILTTHEGTLDLLEKVRTWRRARERLIELVKTSTAGAAVERIGLIHVNNEEGVLKLFEMLKDAMPLDVEPVVTSFTPGLSVHTGAGVIALAVVTAAQG